ncbi:MAG: cytochrome c3 family protein [Nitrospirota bacterium]
MKTVYLILTLSVLLFPSASIACNSCHSKNPKMVLMHQALGFKDCSKCHGPLQKKFPGGLKEQMAADSRCTGCHKK